jgi:hypothetical protein
MMNKELEKWFYNKFNSCYLMEDLEISGNFFMIYDEQFIRQRKLSRVLNEEVKMPTEIKGICLFHLNIKELHLWCNYYEIWSFFEDNYPYSYEDIQEFIKKLLKDNKMRSITGFDNFNSNFLVRSRSFNMKKILPTNVNKHEK